MPTPIGKKRIQLDLSERDKETLKRVAESMDANSYSEVFRRALTVLDHIVDREANGELRFGFANADLTEFTEVWII